MEPRCSGVKGQKIVWRLAQIIVSGNRQEEIKIEGEASLLLLLSGRSLDPIRGPSATTDFAAAAQHLIVKLKHLMALRDFITIN